MAETARYLWLRIALLLAFGLALWLALPSAPWSAPVDRGLQGGLKNSGACTACGNITGGASNLPPATAGTHWNPKTQRYEYDKYPSNDSPGSASVSKSAVSTAAGTNANDVAQGSNVTCNGCDD